jgi:hypothetical protein
MRIQRVATVPPGQSVARGQSSDRDPAGRLNGGGACQDVELPGRDALEWIEVSKLDIQCKASGRTVSASASVRPCVARLLRATLDSKQSSYAHRVPAWHVLHSHALSEKTWGSWGKRYNDANEPHVWPLVGRLSSHLYSPPAADHRKLLPDSACTARYPTPSRPPPADPRPVPELSPPTPESSAPTNPAPASPAPH